MSHHSERATGATDNAPGFFAELAIRMVENRIAAKKLAWDSPELKESWATEKILEEMWERAERVREMCNERGLAPRTLLSVLAVRAVEARLVVADSYDAAAIESARQFERDYADVKQALADGFR